MAAVGSDITKSNLMLREKRKIFHPKYIRVTNILYESQLNSRQPIYRMECIRVLNHVQLL